MPEPLGTKIPSRGWVEDDWRARPTPQRPWPIVLIHGTSGSPGDWKDLAAQLRGLGWAVFVPGYGYRATNPIEESADQIRACIDVILATTGAEKVILVGHSQGGVLARYYIKHLGGDRHTKHVICLSSPNHGTTLGGMLGKLVASGKQAELMSKMIITYFGPAGMQQITGSRFLAELNTGPECAPEVGYTCIATRTDSTVVPAESCFLDTATNLWVQDDYPLAVVLHADMTMDKRVRALVTQTVESLRPVNPSASPKRTR
ncbi:triacylglycerol lipase [Corynebacterium sp.]|uniref:esterase/lipase family protein n=1 Tax=Corynebacterium sp. TaxID=1720 RepID=UPI0026DBF5FE|nr:triacylglycerol lipase [Corynebacterium sp.]MDO5076920.1 triacylglycerol lipase [Corynebacterium sp.]